MQLTLNPPRAATPPAGAEPFSVGEVQTILGKVLKQGKRPGLTEVAQLTHALNLMHGTYVFAQKVANDSKKTAALVYSAIGVLQWFFKIRRTAWEAPGTPPTAVAAEQELFSKFTAFGDAMQAHNFELDMDAGLLMPDITDWHQLAVPVAGAFRLAMAPRNPGKEFGKTAGGPLPRFLAEVLPRITGEQVTAAAAGKCLSRAKGRTGAPPGLVLLTVEECAAAADTQEASEE
jgi:hypothetical protein